MRVFENADLTEANSFGVRARARYLAILESNEDFSRLGEKKSIGGQRTLILGAGSNVLFTDDYDGVVALVRNRGVELLDADANYWYLRAAAGESWDELVRWSLSQGYAGLENLTSIPGSVGAAPIQNIGAYGVELKDRFETLEALSLNDGCIREFPLEACEFDYRTSCFKRREKSRYVITSVTLRLPRKPDFQVGYRGVRKALEAEPEATLSANRISRAISAIRTAKLPDPKRLGNAGSFFKNPTVDDASLDRLHMQHGRMPAFPQADGGHKLSAAWLIERCGWKGCRRGDAGVYRHHSLVLVNHGAATGREIWALAEDIRNSVIDTFGIKLVPEVTVV